MQQNNKGEADMTRQQVNDAINEMIDAAHATKSVQNRVIGGYSVTRYTGRPGRWLIGCNMLNTRDVLRVVEFIVENQSAKAVA